MSIHTQRVATARSTEIRRERAHLRNRVYQGDSLAVMIAFRQPQLEDLELRKLARWVPYIGNVKAARILVGLPERAKLSELDDDQRSLFQRRIDNAERRLLNNRTIPYQHEEAP
jgi:hypothetical protein